MSQELAGKDMGFLTAHSIFKRRTPQEVYTSKIRDSSHEVKKGLYRLTKIDDEKHPLFSRNRDVLFVGGWVDIHVFAFSYDEERMTQLYCFRNVQNSKGIF